MKKTEEKKIIIIDSYKNIPNELKELKQWVVWKFELPDSSKKPTKVPYSTDSKRADTTNSDTWLTFNDAINEYHNHGYNGIGFVFKRPYCGIDLDNVINDDGSIIQSAKEILEQFDSYTEFSPSNKGLHIIILGEKPGNKCKKRISDGSVIEIYDHDRYFTWTGKIYDNKSEIVERQEELDELYSKLFFDSTEIPKAQPLKNEKSNKEIISLIRNSHQAVKFNNLYSGYTTDYTSDSEADYALINILCFWCCGDADQIERIMLSSRLKRNKWDTIRDGRSYLRYSIENALSNFKGGYYDNKSNYYTATVFTESTGENDNNSPFEIGNLVSPIYNFPFDVMSGVAKEYAGLYSETSELNQVFLYFSFLTILGNYLSPHLKLKTLNFPTPRLYTLLLGESDSKKSACIHETMKFFNEVFNNLVSISDISSGEGLLKAIECKKDKENQKVKQQIIITIDELASLIQKGTIKNSSIVSHLCTLFESTSAQNNTKENRIEINNIYLSLIAACTYETYEKTWSSGFTDQGLLNRFLLVPGAPKKSVPLPQIVDENLKKELIEKVRKIKGSIGDEFTIELTEDALKIYTDWYHEIKDKYSGNDNYLVKRIEWHMLKLCMVITLCDNKYEIDIHTINKGIKIAEWQIKVRGILKPTEGDTLQAYCENKIIKYLASVKFPVTISTINSYTQIKRDKGSNAFNSALNNLKRDHEIITVTNGKSNRIWLKHRELPTGWNGITDIK